MATRFKKRRIVLPQHMEVIAEPVASSITVDVVKPKRTAAVSSASKRPLPSSSHSTEAALVDNQLVIVEAMIKSQEVMIAHTIMQVFETCESNSQAMKAIRSIQELFANEEHDDRQMQTLTQTFLHLNAIPTILKAMTQWNESLEFVSLATDILKVLLFHMPTTGHKSFLQHCGTRIIMEACQEHWFLPMIKAAFAALTNAASSLTGNTVVIQECLAFAMKAMQLFSGDAEIQRFGSYFYLKLAACAARSQNNLGRIAHTRGAVASSCHALKRKLEPSNN
ncbi:unnamed protein product [Cylindrotheca closterium]|uniref:Uncharacterized protein n=1 Tax=Cylindrotheca closterium TaxID=2856 RepID=A0AAD2CNT6_9STRA|nr:unnamed protein product [Cylindrotheca closterium]